MKQQMDLLVPPGFARAEYFESTTSCTRAKAPHFVFDHRAPFVGRDLFIPLADSTSLAGAWALDGMPAPPRTTTTNSAIVYPPKERDFLALRLLTFRPAMSDNDAVVDHEGLCVTVSRAYRSAAIVTRRYI